MVVSDTPTQLPDLSKLCLSSREDDESGGADRDDDQAWFRALAGGMPNAQVPTWKPWRSVSTADKRAFRVLADRSENDRFSMGQYDAPYSQTDIDVILAKRNWSIEHVVPRNHVLGRLPGAAEDDEFGWVIETNVENGRRSDHPLVLWHTGAADATLVMHRGVRHYDFPDSEKGRLARKWVYIRALYGHTIDPMTSAQRAHLPEILNLASGRIGYAEGRFHAMLSQSVEERYGMAWKNPLFGQARKAILEDARLRRLLLR